MHGFAAVLVLLGVFWTQTSALQAASQLMNNDFVFVPKSFVLHEPGSSFVAGTMTIHSENQIVEVHVRSGVYSSDTIFDYSKGYIATRLFSRKACFILKINEKYIPELQEIGRLAFERKTMKSIYSPNNVWVEFQSGHSLFGNLKNWFRYGEHIKQLCSGLPLYELAKTQAPLSDQGCASAGIPSILGIKICEKIQ